MNHPSRACCRSFALAVVLVILSSVTLAQFTHRYPKVDGYRHHIYLEGYDLPVLNAGPSDPSPSPDGRRLAFSARGWLWIYHIEDQRAVRVTEGRGMDFRPRWSPDAQSLVFVRDTGKDTQILELTLDDKTERLLIDTPALDLDPVLSADGEMLFYSSAAEGDLDIWRLERTTGAKARVTSHEGLELNPQPLPGAARLLYLSKTRGGRDEIRLLELESGEETVLLEQDIGSQMRPALSPDGRNLVVGLPGPEGWRLWLVGLDQPHYPISLTRAPGLPLTPAWSRDGTNVFFSEADDRQVFRLKKIDRSGGPTLPVPVREWDWQAPTSTVTVRTRLKGATALAPSRLHLSDGLGHPLLPDSGQPRFDSQNGLVYFYSPGSVSLTVPAGPVEVVAGRGLFTAARRISLVAEAGRSESADLDLEVLWDAPAKGWASGDHHFHLNYGGTYSLEPETLIEIAKAEDMQVLTPLMANLNTRFEDLAWWEWRNSDPLIRFGQEVRSHFLGHLGLIGIHSPFWPWYWGPGYPAYGRDDRPNADALRYTRQSGGLGFYVHPVSNPDPLENPRSVPLELIADAVLGELDALEIACLWSDEWGTSEVWHLLLNLGVPIAPSAGTDAFPNFYRSMAVGTTRVVVRTGEELNWANYLDGLREGRSFVTTGPALDFRLSGRGPGAVLEPTEFPAEWTLELTSNSALDQIDILVNGETAWSAPGPVQPGSYSFEGRLEIPSGGWVAARVGGSPAGWPLMASYPFAHTAPIWIGERGSSDAAARRSAAEDLLQILGVAEERLREGYGDAPTPRLDAQLQKARRKLERLAGE